MTGGRDRRGLRARVAHLARRARTALPPGGRSLAGLGLVLGGFAGFLPILGFWMIPLGLALIWFDLSALVRWLRGRGPHDRNEDR
ncbi:hypothetical protein [Rhodovulum euryhalinum]|uniref:Uncharacterized protein n=1 Tax=Rhodovulum euryhalinum TaxID=35805 RepID=A0A4R2KIU1_9RHOB|nr:hypothetical protein [Rhodovulum euryhalinum]TCO72412.1 hypothetical protein EV655_10499 [Rhodovulum euryhalinum]